MPLLRAAADIDVSVRDVAFSMKGLGSIASVMVSAFGSDSLQLAQFIALTDQLMIRYVFYLSFRLFVYCIQSKRTDNDSASSRVSANVRRRSREYDCINRFN